MRRRPSSPSPTRSHTAPTWPVPTSASTSRETSPCRVRRPPAVGARRSAAHERQLGHRRGRGGGGRDAGGCDRRGPARRRGGRAAPASAAPVDRGSAARQNRVAAQLAHPDTAVEANGAGRIADVDLSRTSPTPRRANSAKTVRSNASPSPRPRNAGRTATSFTNPSVQHCAIPATSPSRSATNTIPRRRTGRPGATAAARRTAPPARRFRRRLRPGRRRRPSRRAQGRRAALDAVGPLPAPKRPGRARSPSEDVGQVGDPRSPSGSSRPPAHARSPSRSGRVARRDRPHERSQTAPAAAPGRTQMSKPPPESTAA